MPTYLLINESTHAHLEGVFYSYVRGWPRASLHYDYRQGSLVEVVVVLPNTFNHSNCSEWGVAEGIPNKVIYKSAAANKFYDDG